MYDSHTLVDFEGAITYSTIELLLNRLRENRTFKQIPKQARKRLYGVFVESIDNILKYAARTATGEHAGQYLPKVEVLQEGGLFTVRSGNLVLRKDVEALRSRIDRVNGLDIGALKSLYEVVINRESRRNDTGAGLGLITMAMRSCSDIRYEFTRVDDAYAYFEMQITING